ncbi:MAG: oligoendopeptidase F, partial [Synergistaceae bacterium]|nr:oligoendopeptidase F [Synergistaceae bacterium]
MTFDLKPGGVPARCEVPDEFKWKLSDIYGAEDDWERDFERVKASLPQLAGMAGGLGESASNLLACLKLRDELSSMTEKLYVYAGMKSHEDTADPKYQNLSARARTLSVELAGVSSFVTPEIISIPEERLADLIDEGGFDDYRFMFREISRIRAHVLPRTEEELLARAGDMARAPDDAFSMLTNADMRFPVIRDEDGHDVELTEERYMKYISSRDRSVRKAAFDGLCDTYGKYGNTIGAA